MTPFLADLSKMSSVEVTTEPRTLLRVFAEDRPREPLREVTEPASIANELAEIGVRFERFEVAATLPPDADQAAILAAYRSVVEYVGQLGEYPTVDVSRVGKDVPDPAAARRKFFAEHRHSEDEVRYFVDGSAAFYLRLDEHVYQIVCTRGDLLSVPAGTRHWFDMGARPEFTAIRWFKDSAGWIGHYTGDSIAERFPAYA
jgi:1,2-dihydroxy-3-keto-5-methylthiopentene dioxygenase